jgi:hypothetical protein
MNREQETSFDRRKALAGAVVAGIGNAQESTPEASPEASPSTDDESSANERAEVAIESLNTRLTLVQSDLDAVRNQIDPATIGSLLTQATDLIDQAGTVTDASLRPAFAAMAVLAAGSHLIRAQLTYAGLPSEEARSSRILARAYEVIGEAGTITGTDTEVDISTYITTGQSTYSTAYDLYADGAWAQAVLTAKASAEIASAAIALTTSEESGFRGSRGPRGLFGRGKHDHLDGDGDVADPTTPVEVPAPDFGS